jgi:hypothetical protein
MTKCYKCGGTEIAKGKITMGQQVFATLVFQPEGIKFFSFSLSQGTVLAPASRACLSCGTVWTETNAEALKEFIHKNCKSPRHEESTGIP